MQGWPAIAIARIQGVKNLPSEIVKAKSVEDFGHTFTKRVEALFLLPGNVWIKRLCWRGEVIRAVRAHLVNVCVYEWVVFEQASYSSFRFGLSQRKPISVHIEQIVVGAPTRPGLTPLRRNRTRGRLDPGVLLVVLHKPRPAIGILRRINDDQYIFPNRIEGWVTRSQ